MSSNIILNGTVYNGVEKVNLPLVGGGTACFVDGGASGETLNITDNGMYDVSGYGKVLVNVSGGSVLRAVSLNGAHVSFSNTNTYVADGAAYANTVTPDARYTLSRITVTMGGTDVSATAVSGSRITIANVTGDIVVTAETTAEGLLYQMGQKTFNGTSDYVSTGVKLLENDRDWTICIDFTPSEFVRQATILHCMDESGSPYPGFSLAEFYRSNITYMTEISYNGTVQGSIPFTTSEESSEVLLVNSKLVVVHAAGTTFITAYRNGAYLGTADAGTQPSVNKALIIGANRSGASDSGELRRFFNGVVHKFELWDYAMSAAEATAWA